MVLLIVLPCLLPAARTVWLPCPALPRGPRALSWPRDVNLSGLSCCAPGRLSHYFLSLNKQNHTHAAMQCLPPPLHIFFSASHRYLPAANPDSYRRVTISGGFCVRYAAERRVERAAAFDLAARRRRPNAVDDARPKGSPGSSRRAVRSLKFCTGASRHLLEACVRYV